MERSRLWRMALGLALALALGAAEVQAHVGHDHGGDEEQPGSVNYRRKSLVLVKIYCLIIVFFATFLPGISPYYLRWSEPFLLLGTQFAGGIFLAVSVIHFLPDADATFREHTSEKYPFAFMLACVGYLMTMLADATIESVYGKGQKRELGADVEKDVSTDGKTDGAGVVGCRYDDGSHIKAAKGLAAVPATASYGDALLLIFALCFHSVFEGIAIGIAPTAKDAWKALWTVTLHKVFAAIAMAIALLRILPERPLVSCASYAFAFAISSPIGVAIGIIINATTQGTTADWIYAISMGLASGIFIYVAINHLLAKGYQPDRKLAEDAPFYKFLATTMGVALVAVVLIWD